MFDHKVHHFARKKNRKGQMVNQLVNFTPYKCVVMGKPPKKFFLRDGKVVDSQNREVKDLPPDVMQLFKAMTDEGKRAGEIAPSAER